jgi:transposase
MPRGRRKSLLTVELLPAIEEAIKKFGRKERELRKLLAMRCAICTTLAHAEQEHMVSRTELMAACRAFLRLGAEGLKAKKRPGKKRRLTPEQESQLQLWVAQRRDNSGQAKDWTLKSLVSEIEKTFRVHYAPSGLLKVLDRLGLSWKTGCQTHAKADKSEQADFQKNSRIQPRKPSALAGIAPRS